MATVDLHEAETQLTRLIEALETGEEQEVLIARDGMPAVRMTVAQPNGERRRFGFAKGRYTLSEDFDALDAEIARLIEDGADPLGEKIDR